MDLLTQGMLGMFGMFSIQIYKSSRNFLEIFLDFDERSNTFFG